MTVSFNSVFCFLSFFKINLFATIFAETVARLITLRITMKRQSESDADPSYFLEVRVDDSSKI